MAPAGPVPLARHVRTIHLRGLHNGAERGLDAAQAAIAARACLIIDDEDVAGLYDTALDWLDGLEIVAKGELAVPLVNANWELLTRLATGAKTPIDLKLRADALRDLAQAGEVA